MMEAWPWLQKTPAELTQRQGGQYLLRPVGADQSEQTGLFCGAVLKRQTLKQSIQAAGEQMHWNSGQDEKTNVFFEHESM